MPRARIAKKSTDTDMTPFVDVAFLILSFFIMATKFKPSEPVPIETPNSVSAQPLPENNAVMISIDKDDKVYFSVMSKKDPKLAQDAIVAAAAARGITISADQAAHYQEGTLIGQPFTKVPGYLALSPADQSKAKQEGIPVLDSTNNELVYWIGGAINAFAGENLKFLIKGDGNSKYPTFKAVVDALKKNDQQKYNLVTMPEGVPEGTDLYQETIQKK